MGKRGVGYHEWNIFDVCEKCGIKREAAAIRMPGDRYVRGWRYSVSGVIVERAPRCTK